MAHPDITLLPATIGKAWWGLLAAAALAACGGPVELPSLDPGWSAIEPGGDTTCALGDDYRFFVHPGTVNKLVVDFQGGGACWDAETCRTTSLFYSKQAGYDVSEGGIRDHVPDDNPVRDWYHVFVPYCTGDVHWGDSQVVYGEGTEDEVTIRHRGAVNVGAVLDWVYSEFSRPEQILVTGCSAGAYGSILYAGHLADHYRKSMVNHLADSGAGVITDAFREDHLADWNPAAGFPPGVPALDPETVDPTTLSLSVVYQELAAAYPESAFSQFNTEADVVQSLFYEFMGGESQEEWAAERRRLVSEIQAGVPNFHSYLGAGPAHCIIPGDDFYERVESGVAFRDWFEAVAEGRPLPDVVCEGCEP